MSIIADDNDFIHPEKKGKNPVIKPESIEYDKNFENCIRPKSFDSYIGQSALKETLKISIAAAKKRELPLDHLLFYGPPGLGKTTLAGVIAEQMGVDIKITSEIHRLNKVAEEILYPAMEDFFLDMTTGKSQTVKTLRVPLPKFTLIGATTKAGELSGPLRDRFGIIHRLEFYTEDELAQVITRTAGILNIDITEEGAHAIAKRSRGTPRIANRLVKRVSDYALVKHDGKITEDVANKSLDILKIDNFGLDSTDRALLKLIIEKYDGGPVGIETIAAAIGEDVRTIEDVCEPYLLQAGLLQRTPRGRKVSPAAYRHLHYKNLPPEQQGLF